MSIEKTKGDSILEILLAMAMFMIVLPAIIAGVGSFAGGQAGKNSYFDALVLAEETKNEIQQIKAKTWATVANNGTYTVVRTAGEPTLLPVSVTPSPDAKGYSTLITISDAKRNNGDIVSEGGQTDGATKKVTITIDWQQNPRPVIAEMYITRTDNIESFVMTAKKEFVEGGGVFDGTEATGTSDDDAEGGISVANAEISPEISLKSWWKMTGAYVGLNAEVDAAPNGINNLQLLGTPTFGQGRFGNKVSFANSSQHMVASSSATLELSGQMSILAWVRLSQNPSESPIVYKKMGGAGYELGVDSLGFVQGSVGNGTTAIVAKNPEKNIHNDLWHQLALTYDGTTLKVYVDGVSGGQTGTGVGVLGVNTKPLYIGKNPNTAALFPGDVDDVQIYNTALTEEEINNLRYATYTSPPIALGTNALVHSIGINLFQPAETTIDFQVAVSSFSGGCASASYRFVGPDGTENTYFKTQETGDVSVTGLIPSQAQGGFSNPGSCLRWRVRILSARTYGDKNPLIKDVRFIYSL